MTGTYQVNSAPVEDAAGSAVGAAAGAVLGCFGGGGQSDQGGVGGRQPSSGDDRSVSVGVIGLIVEFLHGTVLATRPDRGLENSPLSPASLAVIKSVAYAVFVACLVVLRDPVLLFSALVTVVSVFFSEWWFLYVVSAVPLVYHITTTFNHLNSGIAPHIMAAGSALNTMLNMVFFGVTLIATWPSLSRLLTLDFAGALKESRRFVYIGSTLAAKIAVENNLADLVGEFVVNAYHVSKALMLALVDILLFLPGIAGDLLGLAAR